MHRMSEKTIFEYQIIPSMHLKGNELAWDEHATWCPMRLLEFYFFSTCALGLDREAPRKCDVKIVAFTVAIAVITDRKA